MKKRKRSSRKTEKLTEKEDMKYITEKEGRTRKIKAKERKDVFANDLQKKLAKLNEGRRNTTLLSHCNIFCVLFF